MMAYVPLVIRPTLPVPAAGIADPYAKQERIATVLQCDFALIAIFLTHCVRQLAFGWFDLENLSTRGKAATYAFSLVLIGLYVWVAYHLIQGWLNLVTSVLPNVIIALVTGVMGLLFSNVWATTVFLSGLLLGGFSIVLGLDLLSARTAETVQEPENNRRTRKVAFTLIFVGILIPYIASGVNAAILNFVMRNLGVFAEHAALIVNKSELAKLQTVADAKGIPLHSCRIDDDNTAVSDVRIWWHRIDERGYVGLNPYATPKDEDEKQTVCKAVDVVPVPALCT